MSGEYPPVEMVSSLAVLGRNIAVVASLWHAFELGAGRVVTQTADWHPGCGLPADEAVIACDQCGKCYKAWNVEAKQAGDCCAWAYVKDGRWYVSCGYGSRYDMDTFAYAGEWADFPVGYAGGKFEPLCDECITLWLAEGKLTTTYDCKASA